MKSVGLRKSVGTPKELIRKSELQNTLEKEKYEFDEIGWKTVNYVMHDAPNRKLKVTCLSCFGPLLF